MRTANPALSEGVMSTLSQRARMGESTNTATIQGTVQKGILLIALVLLGAWWSWSQTMPAIESAAKGSGIAGAIPWFIWGGAIAGMILGLITHWKVNWSPFTAPLYAACEGIFLGAISAIFNHAYPGIALQAISGTLGVFGVMLLLYQFRILRATPVFKKCVIAATAGIALLYVASWILGFFGIHMAFLHEGSTFGIIFSLVVIGIAAMNLVLDFDLVEQTAEKGAPKYFEWYGAFALLVTLVWLYIEILRLLAKMQQRRD